MDEGVVFLAGQTKSEQHKEWAGRLATNTQDVVAVVNRIQVIEKSMWDLLPPGRIAATRRRRGAKRPADRSGPDGAGDDLVCDQMVGRDPRPVASSGGSSNPLLRDVAARAVAVPVFLLGLYLVLRVSG